jgi:predicted transcriptional regulator
VERTTELLRDIWKRGTMVSDIESGSPLGTPIIEVPSSKIIIEVVDIMLRNGVSSILVSEKNTAIGIIDQKGILEKVLKEGKDPKKPLQPK